MCAVEVPSAGEAGYPKPTIRDQAVIEAKRTVVQVIVQLLRTLPQGVAMLDRKIVAAAEDLSRFFHFPVAAGSREALARRLLAALGSQRERALFSISLRTATSGLPAAPIVG